MKSDEDVRGLGAAMDRLTEEVRALRAERDALARRVTSLETELGAVKTRARELTAALTVRLVAAARLDADQLPSSEVTRNTSS